MTVYVAFLELDLPHRVVPTLLEASDDQQAVAAAREALANTTLPPHGANLSISRLDGTPVCPSLWVEAKA